MSPTDDAAFTNPAHVRSSSHHEMPLTDLESVRGVRADTVLAILTASTEGATNHQALLSAAVTDLIVIDEALHLQRITQQIQ